MNEKRLWKLFLLPSLGGVLVFYLLPFVLSLYYGMIDNMGSRQFVGLQNVVETLKNPMFLQAAGNTAVYLGFSIPLILLLSLGLAFLLHRSNSTLLFALLVPLVLPSGVTAFFWNAIFSAGGLVNKILYLLGLPLINWKTSAVAIIIPVILFLWKNTGLITAIMLIGYSRIPQEYYEIAAGEGATPRVCFYKVTLPYLAPTIFLSGLIAVIQSFKVFRELYILFEAYPNPHLYLLQHYMNNQFSSLNLQKLSAAAHILFVLMAVVILLTYFLQKRLSDRFTSVELSPTRVLFARKKTGTQAGKLVLWTAAVVAFFPLLFSQPLVGFLLDPFDVRGGLFGNRFGGFCFRFAAFLPGYTRHEYPDNEIRDAGRCRYNGQIEYRANTQHDQKDEIRRACIRTFGQYHEPRDHRHEKPGDNDYRQQNHMTVELAEIHRVISVVFSHHYSPIPASAEWRSD